MYDHLIYSMKTISRVLTALYLLTAMSYAGNELSEPSVAPVNDTGKDGKDYYGQEASNTRDPGAYRHLIWKVRFDIDRLNKEIEEWGVVTISAPVVMNVQD